MRELPIWNNPGLTPPQEFKQNGWQPGYKPPAQYFNWYMNRSYLALQELQQEVTVEKQKSVQFENDIDALQDHTVAKMPHDSALSQESTRMDGNGYFRTVTFRRADNTTYMISEASQPDTNGRYQTFTWSFYNDAGNAVVETKVWAVEYNADGFPTKKVLQ